MQGMANECVGCADGCHGCGLNRSLATLCDECGAVCYDLVFHDSSGDDLCINCATERACKDFEDLDDKEKLELMNYEEVTV